MRRREVLGAVGGATVWPLMARAQQAVPAVGFFHSTSRAANERLIAAFSAGLREVGFTEAQDVRVDYRWAEGDYGRLSDMASDLVARSVSVIVTAGGVPPALAAKAATRIVPVVFVSGSDPIEFGLVSSLNRPEGNITGVHLLAYARLEASGAPSGVASRRRLDSAARQSIESTSSGAKRQRRAGSA